MDLFRLRIRPLSTWVTPWQADTLYGLLCWMLTRSKGNRFLFDQVLEPASRGEPSFVLSDAFPEDYLPIPVLVRKFSWPIQARKTIAHSKWISPETFSNFQSGLPIGLKDIVSDEFLQSYDQIHNTISRSSNTTAAPGSLFVTQNIGFKKKVSNENPYFLTIYIRMIPTIKEILFELFQDLSLSGFGADSTVGKGSFEIISSDFEQVNWLDKPSEIANSIVILSTFQPGPKDPTDGLWESFIKYGKIGPDFGLDNVFKRPIVVFRPGAFFRCQPFRPYLGHTIPMAKLLSDTTCKELNLRGIEIFHLLFGLGVPCIEKTNRSMP